MKITEHTVAIDGIDKIILKSLLQDARTSIQVIAKASGISGAAVHQRLKKLEKAAKNLAAKHANFAKKVLSLLKFAQANNYTVEDIVAELKAQVE